MSVPARRWLGVALLAGAVLAGAVLRLTGTPLVTVVRPPAEPRPPGESWFQAYVVTPSWTLRALGAAALVGLLLLLWPRRGRRT